MKNTIYFREFAKYAFFNVLGMLGLSLYILADTYFISKSLGTGGLAALNLAIPVYSLIHGLGLMLGMGGATKYSIERSQNKEDAANQIFTNCILLALGFGIFFVLLGSFFSGTMIRLLGADQAVFSMARTYLQVILLFSPAFLLNNVLLCFVRNDGAPQLSMLAMLVGSFSNILLDYLFMFPLGMGIFGAVLATGIAPIISIGILYSFLIRKKNQFHFVRGGFFVEHSSAVFSSGLPSLVTELSSGIVILVFNMILLRLQGNVGIAAYGIIANLSLVVLSIYTGIAQGIQPLISKAHGLGKREQTQLLLRFALFSVGILSVILYFSIFFGASQITGIFNSEENLLLQNTAILGLKIYFTGCIFAGFNIILSVYFTSTECVRPAHLISLLRGFFVIIPMAFLLSFLGGVAGIWCAFPFTELIVAGVGVLFYIYSHTWFHTR